MKLATFLSRGPLRTIVWRTLLVSLLPLLVLAGIVVSVSESVMTARFREETDLAASIATDAIHEKQSLALRGAWLTAGLPTVRELVKARDSQGLVNFLVPLKTRLGVDEINVSGMDGKIFASAQDETETMIDLGLASSQATQAWMIVDDPHDPGLTLRGAAIIRTESGAPIGLIEIGITLGPDFLKSVKGSSNIDLLMITEHGIRSSTLNQSLTGLPRLSEIPTPADESWTGIVRNGKSKWEGSFNNLDSQGVPAALGVLVSRGPLEAATQRILEIVAALCVALSIAVVAMAYRIGLTITTPLQRLTDTAAKIQEGDLAARVERISSNELRSLELGFNGMADSLERFSRNMESLVQQRTARLAALHDFSSQLGRSATREELPELLDHAARITRDVLGVDHAAVLELISDDCARVHDATALTGTRGRSEVVMDATTPCGQALLSSVPVVIEDIANEPTLTSRIWDDAAGSASVIVPGQAEPFGVLTAQSSTARAFDHDEVEFVQSVANALGQAIERIRAVDDLREEHARTEHLLASIPSVLIGVDVDGLVQLWNQAAEEVFEIRSGDAMRRSLEAQQLKWNRDEVTDAINECISTGRIVHLDEIRYERPSGGDRYLTMTLTPILGDEGMYAGYLLIGVDVTERRELQDQLHQSQRLESIGRLAAGIAHEINTPTQYVGDNVRFLSDAFRDVNGLVTAYEELLERVATGADGSTVLDEAHAAAKDVDLEFLTTEIPEAISQSLEGIERVASIVRAMKEFSHPGATEAAPADLNHAIETTIAVSRNEWKYVADVVTDFDEDLVPVPCLLGPLNQAFLNIIVNAAHAITDAVEPQAGARGTITVSTRQDGDMIEVRIADTGTGIPEEIRNRIFDPFFTTKGVGRGTGQGLAIARSVVVEKHGGEIRCESIVGRGTTFVIRLPLSGPRPVSLAA